MDPIMIGVIMLIALVAISVSIAIFDYSPTQTFTTLSGEVEIGLIVPLTGGYSTYGQENVLGSKLGLVKFNEYLANKSAPWNLTLKLEDSETDPARALEKVTLFNTRGTKLVIGPETSSNVLSVKRYADLNDILIISCCSTSPALALDDNIFRLTLDDTNQGKALAALLQNNGIKAIVPVWRDDSWGNGLSTSARDSFKALGGTVDVGHTYNTHRLDFNALMPLLSDTVQTYVDTFESDKVAVLYIGFSEVTKFMQTASNYDVLNKVKWFGVDSNTKEPNLIQDQTGLDFATNVQFTTVQMSVTPNETRDMVKAHIMDALDRDPSTYAYSSYDAVWILGLALLEAQTNDPDTVKKLIPSVAEKYSGALGSTKLNAVGDLAQADYGIWSIRDGEWIQLGKYTDSVEMFN